MISFDSLREKTLTPAEKKKREEIAKAIEKDDPDMPMDKKMAIATATAKRVAEFNEKLDLVLTVKGDKNVALAKTAMKKFRGISVLRQGKVKSGQVAVFGGDEKQLQKMQSALAGQIKGLDMVSTHETAIAEDVNEAIDFFKVAKEFEQYARKHGGIDKKDFMRVAQFVRQLGKESDVNKQDRTFIQMKHFIDKMDTDPRDGVITLFKKNGMVKNNRLVREYGGPKISRADYLKKGKEYHAEGFTPKEIKMAIGVASDKRYAGGNYTGAVKAIEKIKKGLSKHKQVAAVLRSKNEAVSPAQQAAIAISKKERGEKPKNECASEVDFKPHMMYNPKTGEGVMAKTYADHIRLDKKGYTHEKPKETVKESMLNELAMPRKDFDKLKKGDEVTITYDSSIRKGTTTTFVVKGKSRSAKYNVDKVSMLPKGKTGGMKYFLYSRGGKDATLALGDMGAVMTKIVKEQVGVPFSQIRERKDDYPLYHKTYSSAMAAAYAYAKKKGYEVDPDDIDSKVATGPRKPSSGKTNSFTLKLKGEKRRMLAVQVTNLDNKRYELNTYIT